MIPVMPLALIEEATTPVSPAPLPTKRPALTVPLGMLIPDERLRLNPEALTALMVCVDVKVLETEV